MSGCFDNKGIDAELERKADRQLEPDNRIIGIAGEPLKAGDVIEVTLNCPPDTKLYKSKGAKK